MTEEKRVYQLDDDGIWTGHAPVARPDPRVEDRYLIPRGCVEAEPPTLASHEAARYVDGSWTVVADWRGHVYWTADRVRHEITDIGVVPPDGALDADPGPTAAELWAAHQAQAQAALDASDMVALRCFKAGVAFPSEWLSYVSALRAVVRATSGDPTQALPTRPAYPSGT
jgi:hypothetical protein